MNETELQPAVMEMFKPLIKLAALDANAKANKAFIEDLVRSYPRRKKGDFQVSRTTSLTKDGNHYLRIEAPRAPVYVLRRLTTQGDKRSKIHRLAPVSFMERLGQRVVDITHPLNNLAGILNEAAGEPLFHSTVGLFLRVTITEANVEKLREKSSEATSKIREILLEPEAACQARGGWRVAAHKLLRQPPTRPPEDNPLPPESISQPQQEERASYRQQIALKIRTHLLPLVGGLIALRSYLSQGAVEGTDEKERGYQRFSLVSSF